MSGKNLFGSVLIALLGMGIISLIGLPIVYPSLQADFQGESGEGVLQTTYLETSSWTHIHDEIP